MHEDALVHIKNEKVVDELERTCEHCFIIGEGEVEIYSRDCSNLRL